tara:strand:- start:33 stop:203 length:171 start_codon:yes stop_codon:yes gene_type:complete
MNIKTAKYISYMEKNITIKVTQDDDTIVWIPIDIENTDYQLLQEWVAEGNTIEEAD